MALSGTLKDLGIVGLLQFPNVERKTGLLTIESSTGVALLYYEKGDLVHASLGDSAGEEVLINLIELEDGEFEFKSGVETEEKTFTDDLHRTLMRALKSHDERKQDREADCIFKKTEVSVVRETLSEFCASQSTGCLVALYSKFASEIIFWPEDSDPEILKGFVDFTSKLYEGYPFGSLDKCLLEGEEGMTAISSIGKGVTVVIRQTSDASLGLISRNLNRLKSKLEEILKDEF